MANPLMGMMGSAGMSGMNMQAVRQIKQTMNMFKAMKNPLAAMQQVPQLNSIIQMLAGRDPETVFREECKKHGADPEQIISLLKS